MRTFLGVICKPPRQLQIFLAAYKICHEIIFSWLLTSTAKVTLYSLAVQSWPPRKSLATKIIRFWCSVYIASFGACRTTSTTPRTCGRQWQSTVAAMQHKASERLPPCVTGRRIGANVGCCSRASTEAEPPARQQHIPRRSWPTSLPLTYINVAGIHSFPISPLA